ncbi:MAG: polysaccharide deacetylase family protein [Chloroflexota bacterium]
MDPGPVRIYVEHDSPRLQYIASLILGEILGLQFEITTDKRKTKKRPVINYSEENIPGAFRIIPETLLFEQGIEPKDISVTSWKNLPVFFSSVGECDFPFDVFAASFYLVSRYEEYTCGKRDEHGRFEASSSVAYVNGFLNMPVVDLWSWELARAFIRKFRDVAVRKTDFRSMITIDADEPFAYLGRNLFSSLGDIVGDMKTNKKKISERFRTMTHEENDPYDVFAYITGAINKNRADAGFFFPVGDHSKYDRNPSWKFVAFRNLVSRISGEYKTGLHPSYLSFSQKKILEKEKHRLAELTRQNVSTSRFHYLRFRLPDSYRLLNEVGITEDYSMGYADEPGFRAGLARPFYFYDVIEDRSTSLKVFPFMIMDETLFNYRKLGKDAASGLLDSIIRNVRRIGGTFICIWHNTSLLDTDEGRQQREVFELMLENMSSDPSS